MKMTGMEIAVVGMACRFPKSRNIWEFWEHLCAGDELITHFSEEDLESFGVDTTMKSDPGYVAAEAIIDHPGHFDASFFNIAESDAMTMDPQQRLLLECAWHAMEDGGYAPEHKAMNCGVFVSGGNNKYYLKNVLSNPDKIEEVGDFQIEIGNSVNFLATRISYLFNLTGPASVVQTACSSSLVAIHYACQSLLNGECDMALSGGSKVEVPQNYGHIHTEGGVKSKEGHCRVFDKEASGFVNGNGCGMVLLKRLEDALADGDEIYGMIKGSALNNDGSEKIGYTAPSITGQKQVIEEALDIAEVSPESIAYIETHGTGTKLGDPIEIDGLKQVFKSVNAHCALGSVKANMGHLDAAAGVAGFIKAVLVLYHRKICPQINFSELNPAILLEGSPFYISSKLTPFSESNHPFRAGVSSFGIGGTNAHLVLEEASKPDPKDKIVHSAPYAILTNTAKSQQSLIQYETELAAYLKNRINIDDLAITSWLKRPQFEYRSAVVAKSSDILASRLLESEEPTLALKNPKIFFLFPGQGSQYTNMTRELYQSNTTYKTNLDSCLDFLQELSGIDFKSILFPEGEIENRIHETQYAQPLIFSVEYALTKVLAELGVVPDAMIGHSLGEVTAACIAGAMTLRSSLKLVLIRSQLMQKMPRGSMVSISLNGERKFLEELPDNLCIAAINSEANYVISGETLAVDTLEEKLTALKIKHRRLQTSHAYHSPMMQGMLEEFESGISDYTYDEPKVPFVSNLSGGWIQANDISADYWKRHIANPVRFLDGIRLLNEANAVLIEVGPGSALSYLASQTMTDQPITNLVPPNAKEPEPLKHFYEGLGKIWEHGVSIDLGRVMSPNATKIRLPGYSFDHKNFWLPIGKPISDAVTRSSEELTYAPYWRSILFGNSDQLTGKNCLLLATSSSHFLVKKLKSICKLVVVQPGKYFKGSKHSYQMDFGDAAQYDELFRALKATDLIPHHVIHGLSITSKISNVTIQNVDNSLNEWYYSLLNFIRAFGPQLKKEVALDVLTNDAFAVLGRELISPLKSTLAGPVKIAPLEFERLNTRLIEFNSEERKRDKKAVSENILSYIKSGHQPRMKVVALRGDTFWENDYQPVKVTSNQAHFRKKGVYLVTGGFGGMGSSISTYLVKHFQAKVALFSSSSIPSEDQWKNPLNENERRKVALIRTLRELGGEVKPYEVDIANHSQMKLAIADLLNEWGEIHGVIHTAGRADFGGILANRDNKSIHEILTPKIHGHLVLKDLTAHLSLDFFINFSSIGNQVYRKKFGQMAYNTANEYLDSCASGRSIEKTINWCDWLDVGMAFDSVKKKNDLQDAQQINAKVLHGISPDVGIELFKRIVSSSHSHTLISPVDLINFITTSNEQKALQELSHDEGPTKFSKVELSDKLTGLYKSFFGVEQLDTAAKFNDLGGDSLKAVVLLSRIKKKLKLPLTLSEFYEHSSIEALVSFLSTESNEEVVQVNTENFLVNSHSNAIFGTWYTSTQVKNQPIILCPPVFQEEIIADRALNSLSDRLASLHSPIVRFDFAGMGNSEGSHLQLTLEEWLQNLLKIISKTQDKFQSEKVHLIGLRMGATLINSFAEQLEAEIDQLLLWHPVINGIPYLNDLNKYQKQFIKGSFGDPTGLNKGRKTLEFNSYQISQSLQKNIRNLVFDPSRHGNNLTLLLSEEYCGTINQKNGLNLIASKSPPFWNKLASEKGFIPEKDIETIAQWHKDLIT